MFEFIVNTIREAIRFLVQERDRRVMDKIMLTGDWNK